MGAISGDVNSASFLCATIADLSSRADAALKDGDVAYVESVDSYFIFKRQSTPAANGITVVASSSGNRFFRQVAPFAPSLVATAWWIDPAAGSDQNNGTSALTPLATWAEFKRRVTQISANTTVTILSPIGEILDGYFEGAPGTYAPSLTVIGTPTVSATGTILVAANPDPAANAEGTLTSAAIPDFTAFAGQIVEALDGAAAGAMVPILFGAGTAQVPFWSLLTGIVRSHPLPVAGVAIRVIDPMQADTVNITGSNVQFYFRYLKFDNSTNAVPGLVAGTVSVDFIGCEIGLMSSTASRMWFMSCTMLGSPLGLDSNLNTRYDFFGCGILGQLTFRNGNAAFDGTISIAALDFGSDDEPGAPWVRIGGSGLGVFNSASFGIRASDGAWISVEAALYGNGNTTFGCAVDNGARVVVDVALTPTISGTTADLRIDGNATLVPPLIEGALAVPAASALNNWGAGAGGWGAAPFSRYAVNYAFLAGPVGAPSMAGIIGT